MDISVPTEALWAAGISAAGGICWLAFNHSDAYERFLRLAIPALFVGCMAYLIYVLGFARGHTFAIDQVEAGATRDLGKIQHHAWPIFAAMAIFIALIVLQVIARIIDLKGEKSEIDKK